jgi:hypothetical protein
MTKPMPRALSLQTRMGLTLLTSLAAAALAFFATALATVAVAIVLRTSPIGPDGALLALKATSIAFLIGAMLMHHWLWAKSADARQGRLAAD